MNKVLLLLAFFFVSIYSEVKGTVIPTWEWIKTDGTIMYDYAFYDNHIYTIGTNLKKFDTAGNLIWTKPISGSEIEFDNNHDIIIYSTMYQAQVVLGAIVLTNNGGADILVMKLDTAGNYIWANNYGSNSNDWGGQMCIDYNDNIYLLGNLNSKHGIIKISSTGILNWTKAINQPAMAPANNIHYPFHFDYSAYDSTLVLSGAFMGTFSINNFAISAGYNANFGFTNDIYLAKIDLDSNVLFLNSATYSYRDDFDNNSMYISNSTGRIYLNITIRTFGSGTCAVVFSYKPDGSYTPSLINQFCDNFAGKLPITNSMFGDNDSLISIGSDYTWSDYDSIYSIFNVYTGALINSYYYYTSINKVMYGDGKIYFITDSSRALRKLGDPTFVPMSVYSVIDDSVCANTPFNKNYFINSGYPPYTISWSPTAGLTNPSALNPGFNLDSTTTYVLSVTDSNNTTIHDTVTFTVFAKPHDSIIVTGNSFFCYGINDSVQLSSNMPGLINKWTSSNLGVIANDTATIWAYANNTYTLTTTNTVAGCSSNSTITLNWYPNYPAMIANDSLIFYGDSVVVCNTTDSIELRNYYNIIPDSKISWYKNGLLIDSNVQSIKTNTNGQYVLKITDSICSHADTLDVFYSSVSVAAHVTNNPVCKGDTVLLYGSGAPGYTWTNNVTDSIPFVALQSKLYVVTGIDMMGCTSTAQLLVTVNPSYNYTDSKTACIGSDYVFPDGFTITNITSPFTHTSYLQTIKGCDSILTYNVVIKSEYDTTIFREVCFGSNYVFPDGSINENVVEDTIQTSNIKTKYYKCDSIVHTHLKVLDEIDNTITGYRTHFSSNDKNGAYLWFRCDDTPMLNETNRVFYPQEEGDYYVAVYKLTCIEKSPCFKFQKLQHETSNTYCTLFPNPAIGNITVDYASDVDGNFRLYNSIGQVIFNTTLSKNNNKAQINVEGLSEGLYNYEVRFKKIKSYTGKLTIMR